MIEKVLIIKGDVDLISGNVDFVGDVHVKGDVASGMVIKAKGQAATAKEGSEIIVLEVAYEMYARGYEFMDMKLGISHATKFDVVDGKVLLPFMALSGMGETAAKSFKPALRNPF